MFPLKSKVTWSEQDKEKIKKEYERGKSPAQIQLENFPHIPLPKVTSKIKNMKTMGDLKEFDNAHGFIYFF